MTARTLLLALLLAVPLWLAVIGVALALAALLGAPIRL